MKRVVAVAAVVTGMASAVALAEDTTRARVINGGPTYQTLRLPSQYTDNFRYVDRQVVAPEAVVSRELSEQPVYTHLAELQVVTTTILIDPKVNYVHKDGRPGGIDEDHSIVKASRLWHQLQERRRGASARTVYGNPAPAAAAAHQGTAAEPQFILIRPDGAPGLAPAFPGAAPGRGDAPRDGATPTTPVPAKPLQQMASTH